MHVIELYECPPLHARMTLAQCDSNRARAGGAPTRRRLHKALAEASCPARSECVKCPGVLWWAKHTGIGPRKLETDAVARGIAIKEEQRRRLAGVPLVELSPRRPAYADDIATLLRSAGRL